MEDESKPVWPRGPGAWEAEASGGQQNDTSSQAKPTPTQPQIPPQMAAETSGPAHTRWVSPDLPAVVSEDASKQKVEPRNVQCVAVIGAAYEIEAAGVFEVVDKLVELFLVGTLPVRDDSGGQALYEYYWQADSQLDAAGRARLYGRVLGRGDTGNTYAQPNTSFEQLMMRFVSALVCYDSMAQTHNAVTTDLRDTLSASEQVRKAGQDFAAYANLLGRGCTMFEAGKISDQIDNVFEVLGQETLQRAYGVSDPWQLVERVSSIELGSKRSIVQHRTRAQAVKDLLDLLAVYAAELSHTGDLRRFLPNIDEPREMTNSTSSTVTVDDYKRMVIAASNLLRGKDL